MNNIIPIGDDKIKEFITKYLILCLEYELTLAASDGLSMHLQRHPFEIEVYYDPILLAEIRLM